MDFTTWLNKIEEKFFMWSARFWGSQFQVVRRVGDGNLEWIEGSGLQSFPHSKKCLSSFYKSCWSDRLEIKGNGLALCKEKISLIDQGRLTGPAINSNLSGGWS